MPMRRHVLVLSAFAALLAGAPALCAGARSMWSRPSRSSATWCSNVGGDRVEVAALVGPNSDTHVFSPTPADAKKLAAAKVVFVNGLGLEGWMTRLVSASGSQGADLRRQHRHQDPQDGGRASPGPDGDRSARLAVDRQCQDLRRQHPRRSDHGRSRRQERLRGQCHGLSRQARCARAGGEGGDRKDSRRPPADHHDPRCVRLFRRRLRHGVHLARRRLDRCRSRRPGTWPRSSRRSGSRKFRRCSWRTSPTRA